MNLETAFCKPSLKEFRVAGIKVHPLNVSEALKIIFNWLQSDSSFHYLVSTNFNNLSFALESAEYFDTMEKASLSLPDGVPLLWYARLLGYKLKGRCGIEEVMEAIFALSQQGRSFSHFFYGNTWPVLNNLKANLLKLYPNINIAGLYSPPFCTLSPAEEEEIIHLINNSNADFLWVSLGCPKQELWLYRNRFKLKVKVAGGAGAVFNTLAGVFPRAPYFLRKAGLEWLWRLILEPRRLAKRYLIRYPLFFIKLLINRFTSLKKLR